MPQLVIPRTTPPEARTSIPACLAILGRWGEWFLEAIVDGKKTGGGGGEKGTVTL